MDKKMLAMLCTLLGLKADATEADAHAALEAACKAMPTGVVTLSALTELATNQPPTAAKTDAPDPAQYVPVSVVQEMQAQVTQLAALVQAGADAEMDKQIQSALADGRLSKPLEAWARGLAKSDPTALTAFLATQQPIAALAGRTQTGGQSPAADGAGATKLSAEDKYVVEQLGLDPKAYLAARQAEEK